MTTLELIALCFAVGLGIAMVIGGMIASRWLG